MSNFFLAGSLILLLTACRSMRTLAPTAVLQKSMHASATLSSVSYTVRATHTTESDDHTNVLLQGNLQRESQKHDWHMSVEHNGIFIGSTAGVSVEPDDMYLLPLPATLLEVIQDRGRTPLDNHTVYRYDVALRKEAGGLLDTLTENPSPLSMFRFTGTLWIDTESFLLRRSTWDITTQERNEIMRLDVTLKDHNATPTTRVPNVVEEWSPQTRTPVKHIFENIPPSLSLLLGIPKVTDEMQ